MTLAGKNATLWSRPGFLARRLHQIHVAVFLEECAEVQLTPIQWGIMTVVAGMPGLGHMEIAEQIGLDRSNVSEVIGRLVERKVLRQRPNPRDRRRKSISLTDHGRALMARFERRVQRSQDRLLEPLAETERRTFVELLQRIVDRNNELSRAPLRFEMRGEPEEARASRSG